MSSFLFPMCFIDALQIMPVTIHWTNASSSSSSSLVASSVSLPPLHHFLWLLKDSSHVDRAYRKPATGFLSHIPLQRGSRAHIPVFTLIPLHTPKCSLHFENILGCWDRMPCRLATPRVSQPAGSHNHKLWVDTQECQHSPGYGSLFSPTLLSAWVEGARVRHQLG